MGYKALVPPTLPTGYPGDTHRPGVTIGKVERCLCLAVAFAAPGKSPPSRLLSLTQEKRTCG